MLESFWLWTWDLAANSPMMFGLIVVLTMAGLGMAIAMAADLLFYVLKIDLGKYKKEYEEGGGLH